ncbi:ADP-ribosylglycohydrolase family protein [Nocardia sp. BMG51109]|uniref:ADP-ribosylglycohydrolase family protein n=1 Tax=Nocardia sp. BMG51109 TaxID=1056816 RepID=UPI001E4D52D8|nr:ADP-ribosylglycohydrolase family protein [Nocardia sp. BMG51109]
MRDGAPWREVSAAAFGHRGSCGNGAAVRVAPLGAFYADDPERIAAEAVRSAQVTHLHPEGVAGAVAVALTAGPAAPARLTRIPARTSGIHDRDPRPPRQRRDRPRRPEKPGLVRRWLSGSA